MSHREAELDFIKRFLTSIEAWVLEHTPSVGVCFSGQPFQHHLGNSCTMTAGF